jgi:hypothetical protein
LNPNNINPSALAASIERTLPNSPRLCKEAARVLAEERQPTATARPLTRTQLLMLQPTYTCSQQLPSNFLSWFIANNVNISVATTMPISRLIAMLDAEHCEGSRFAVVSKGTTRGHYVTTVLDVPLRKVLRAKHATGMVSFWKGLAKRRERVEYVPCGDAFVERK